MINLADLILLMLLSPAASRLVSATGGNLEESSGMSSMISIENLSTQLSLLNVSDNGHGVWVLIPNNMTESQLSATNFNLFKLNTEQPFGGPGLSSSEANKQNEGSAVDQLGATDRSEYRRDRREARKMNFFPNFMKKPKVSPLYLVNGTVCRFVNTQPICTTLTTTGLFGGNTRPGTNNNGGLINGLSQQNQQQQSLNQFQQNGQLRQTLPINQQG